MMICSEIAKKLKKINSSILNTKGKCMNKYTICDNQTEQVKNDFDKDLVLAKQKELINEILNLTDKYLTKASDFEIAEIKAISAKIKSDGALNKQIIYKNDEDEIYEYLGKHYPGEYQFVWILNNRQKEKMPFPYLKKCPKVF